jgi:hypothetical protein
MGEREEGREEEGVWGSRGQDMWRKEKEEGPSHEEKVY